jgi:hypothetical protein
MRPSICGVLFASLLFLPAASAQAITCYLVYDRNDNAIFQDTYPPIDLSDRGTAEREAMYRRGEHLIVMEADRCPTILFFTGSGGNTALSVDQIVGGIRASAISPAGSAARPATARAASSAAPPASAPKAAAPKY